MDFNLMISIKGSEAFFRDEKSDINTLDNSFLKVGDESYSFKDILENSDIDKLEPKIISDSVIGDQDLKYIGKLLKDKKDLIVAKLQEINKDPVKNVQLELKTKNELERLNIVFSFISSSVLEKENKVSNLNNGSIYNLESKEDVSNTSNISERLSIDVAKEHLKLPENIKGKSDNPKSIKNNIRNIISSESLVLISNKINTKITSMIENKAAISGIEIYLLPSKNKIDKLINNKIISKETNFKSNQNLDQFLSNQGAIQAKAEQNSKNVSKNNNFVQLKNEDIDIKDTQKIIDNKLESKVNKNIETKTYSSIDSNILKPIRPEKTFFVAKLDEKAFYKDINKLTADIYSYRNFSNKSENKKNIIENDLPKQGLKVTHNNVNINQVEKPLLSFDSYKSDVQVKSSSANTIRPTDVMQTESPLTNVDSQERVIKLEDPEVNTDRHANVDQIEKPLINEGRHKSEVQLERPIINTGKRESVVQTESSLTNFDSYKKLSQTEIKLAESDIPENIIHGESLEHNTDRHENLVHLENSVVNDYEYIKSEIGKHFVNETKEYKNIEQEEKTKNVVKKYLKPEQSKSIKDNNEPVKSDINSENKITIKPTQVKSFSEVYANKINIQVNSNEVVEKKTEKINDKVKDKSEVKTNQLEADKPSNKKENVYSDLYNSFVNNSRKFIYNLNENKKLSNITTVFAGDIYKSNNETEKNDKPEIKKVIKTYNIIDNSIVDYLKSTNKPLNNDKKTINENTDLSTRLENKYKSPVNNLENKVSKEGMTNLKESNKQSKFERQYSQLSDSFVTLSTKFVSKLGNIENNNVLQVQNNVDINNSKLIKENISEQKISPDINNVLVSKAFGKTAAASSLANKRQTNNLDNFSINSTELKANIKEVKLSENKEPKNNINLLIEKNELEEKSVNKSLSINHRAEDEDNLSDIIINNGDKLSDKFVNLNHKISNVSKSLESTEMPLHNDVKNILNSSSLEQNIIKVDQLNINEPEIQQEKFVDFPNHVVNNRDNVSGKIINNDSNKMLANMNNKVLNNLEEKSILNLLDNKDQENNFTSVPVNIEKSNINNTVNKNISIFDKILDLKNESVTVGLSVVTDKILDLKSIDISFNLNPVKTSSGSDNNFTETLGQDINKIVPDIYSYKNKFGIEKIESSEKINIDPVLDKNKSSSFNEEVYQKFISNPINLQLADSFGKSESNLNVDLSEKINLPSIQDVNFIAVKSAENNKSSFVGKSFITNKTSESFIDNKVYSFLVANKLPENLNVVSNQYLPKNKEIKQMVNPKGLFTASISKAIKKDPKENLDDISKRLLEKLESLQVTKTNDTTISYENPEETSVENPIDNNQDPDSFNLDENKVVENNLEKEVKPILDNRHTYLALNSFSLFKNKYISSNIENTKEIKDNKLTSKNDLLVSNLESNKIDPKNVTNPNLFSKFNSVGNEAKKDKLFNRPETLLVNNSDNRQLKNQVPVKSNPGKSTVLFEKEIKNYITKNPDKNIFVGEISLNINNKFEKFSNNRKFENLEVKTNKNIVTENLHKKIINRFENRFENKVDNKFTMKKYEIKAEKNDSLNKDIISTDYNKVEQNVSQKPITKNSPKLVNNSADQLTKNNFIGISIEQIKTKTQKNDVFSKSIPNLLESKLNNIISQVGVKANPLEKLRFNKSDSTLAKNNKENIINRTEVDMEENIYQDTQEYDQTIFTPFEADLKSDKFDDNYIDIVSDDYKNVELHETNLIQNILVNSSLYIPNLIKETNFDGNNIVNGNKKLFTLFSNNLSSEYPEIDLIQMRYEGTYNSKEMNIVNKSEYLQDQDFKENKFSNNQVNEKFIAEELEINYDEMDNYDFVNEELVDIDDSSEDSDVTPLMVNNIATIIDSINSGIPIHFSEIPEVVKVISNSIKNNKPFVLNISLNPFNMGEMNMTFKLTEGNKMSISVETSTLAGHRAMESYFANIKNIVKENSMVLQEMVSNYSPDIKSSRNKDRQDSNAKFDNESSNSEAGTGQQTRKKKRRGKSEEKDELKVDV